MEQKLETKPEIQIEKIREVYTGRPGCACGCRGTYSESPRTMKHVLKKFAEASKVFGFEGGVYFDNEDGTRTYTIYFKNEMGE